MTNLTQATDDRATELARNDQIVSVYSGRPNKCCCGCSGQHRYNSQHAALGAKRRGYAVDKEDINDRQVAKVRSILLHAPVDEVEKGDGLGDRFYYSTESNGRLYIAYTL